MRQRTLPLLTLLLLACPLFGSQEITPPTYGPTAYAITNPVVATNGTTFLTLWTIDTNIGGKQIYGSIADAQGNLISSRSILLVHNAAVVNLFARGSDYVAVIADQNGIGPLRTVTFSNFAGVQPVGPAVSLDNVIAFDGSEFFSIRNLGTSAAVGRVVRLDGTVIRDGIALGAATAADVTSTGSEFVVAIADADGITIRRFGNDGREIATTTRVRAFTRVASIAVASSGNEDAVAWWDGNLSPTSNIAITPRGGTPSESLVAMPGGTVQLKWNGTSFLLLSGAGRIAKLSRSGAVDGIVATPDASSFAANATTAYAVGTSSLPNHIGYRRVIATVVNTTSTLIAREPQEVSIMLRRQVWPLLATDGTGFLAVWSDETAGDSTLSAAALDSKGAPVGSLTNIGAMAQPDDLAYRYATPLAYSVASGQNIYLVVWQSGIDIVANRLDRSGRLLDAQPIRIRSNATTSEQAVAWNGQAFLTTWFDKITGRSGGNFITEAGVVSAALQFEFNGSLAWDGTRFLLTAIHNLNCSILCALSPDGLLMSRLAADGSPIDSAPVFLAVPATSYRVATSGQEFVIASDVQTPAGGLHWQIELRRVSASAAKLEIGSPKTVFDWAQPTISELSWNGNQYVLAWRYGFFSGSPQWVGLMRFSHDLDLFDRLYAAVSPDVYDRPAIARTASGDDVVALSEINTPGSAARIDTRTAAEMTRTPDAPPAPIITSANGTAQSATVTWREISNVPVTGFIIESINPFSGSVVILATVSGDVTSAVVSIASQRGTVTPQDMYIQVLAFNPGGVSAPTAPFHILGAGRARSVRH